MTDFVFQEWQTYTPESTPALFGPALDDASVRRLAVDMAQSGRVRVLELRDGLQVETTSYVGKVQLGNLQLTIRPKLQGLPLVSLLRYAYGLRDLKLFETLPQDVSSIAFHDLLLHQLAVEISELFARGLQRRYRREESMLASPRGRIDFTAMAREMGAVRAALPCSYYPRHEDTLHNQVILAGLRYGTHLTDDLLLRVRLRRLAALLADDVTLISLNAELLRQVWRHDDRLTTAYRPALAIIELLLAGKGTSLSAEDTSATVPGFLFDMNRFFQMLISRFLHQYLTGYIVRDEHRLQGMLAYDTHRNPRGRRAPTPRPDFVILQGTHIRAMLDAKYRDLWEKPLPREMLYQLVIYATSSEARGQAIILYPVLTSSAQDACIEVRDPLNGGRRAEVILRPVDMMRLEKLVAGPGGVQQTREAQAYAHWLASGGLHSWN